MLFLIADVGVHSIIVVKWNGFLKCTALLCLTRPQSSLLRKERSVRGQERRLGTSQLLCD